MAAVGVSVAAATLPAAAGAAWTPPEAPLGVVERPVLVTGPAPGQVALAGLDIDQGSRVIVAAHAPGLPWAARAPLTGDRSFTPTFGDGGGVATDTEAAAGDDTGAPRTVRIGSDGGLADLGDGTAAARAEGIAIDSSGATLTVAIDGDGKLLLGRRGVGATASPSPTGWRPLDATSAGVAARPGGGFLVVFAAADGTVVPVTVDAAGRATTGASLGVAAKGTSISGVSPMRGGPGVGAAWIETGDGTDDDPGDKKIRAATAASPAVDLSPAYSGRTVLQDVEAIEAADGAIQVLWTMPAGDTDSTTLATAAAGSKRCGRTLDLAAAAAPLRRGDGVAIGGVQAASGALVVEDVGPDCAQRAVSVGPVVPAPLGAGAAIDAEGSFVVSAALQDGRTVVATDDRAAPGVDLGAVPPEVAPGTALRAGVTDAWGVASVEWKLDGTTISSATEASIPPSTTSGAHTLSVTARDVAGTPTTVERSIRVVAEVAPPTPPADPAPALPATPAPEPAVPPVDVSVPGPKRPVPSNARPRVAIDRVFRGRDGIWRVRLRLGDAARLRVSLLRETYRKGPPATGRPRTCRPRPITRRPATGLRGTAVLTVSGSKATVRLPQRFADALAKRGRYTVAVEARGPRSASRSRVARDHRRFTVC